MADVAELGVRIRLGGAIEAIAGIDRTTAAGRKLETQANRINSSLIAIAQQATGTNPAIARLASTFGMLGLGSPIMVGVLGGIAAVSLGWRAMHKDADELTAKINEQIKSLKELQQQLDFGAKAPLLRQKADIRAKIELLSENMSERYGAMQSAAKPRLGGLVTGGLAYSGTDPKIAEWTAQIGGLVAGLATLDQALARIDSKAGVVGNAVGLPGTPGALKIYGALPGDGYRTDTTGTGGVPGVGNWLPNVPIDPNSGVSGNWVGGGPRGNASPPLLNNPSSSWAARHAGALNYAAVGGGAALGLLSGTSLGDSGAAAGLGSALQYGAMGAQFGPYGAILGATAGFVKGLFDHAKKAQEAAEQMALAQRQMDLNLYARTAALAGDDAGAEGIRQKAAAEKELADARKAGLSKASIAELAHVQALEATAAANERAAEAEKKRKDAIEATLRTSEDLISRAFGAAGQAGLAGRSSMIFGQRREMMDATANGMSGTNLGFLTLIQSIETRSYDLNERVRAQTEAITKAADEQLAALADQRELAQAALQVQQDQLRASEQTVNALRSVVDGLTGYGASLKTGGLSPLTPLQQYSSARSQFDAMYALAQGGDLSAASSIQGAGNTFLGASGSYNARAGSAYGADFQRVQDAVNALLGKFGPQLTTEEMTLAELRKQTAQMQDQISRAQQQTEAVRAEAQRQIDAINSQAAEERARWGDEVQKWIQQHTDLYNIWQSSLSIKQRLDLGIPVAYNDGTFIGRGDFGNKKPGDTSLGGLGSGTATSDDLYGVANASLQVQQTGFQGTINRLDNVESAINRMSDRLASYSGIWQDQ